MDEKAAAKSEVENVRIAEIEEQGRDGINASGHIQELDRNFNLLSISGLAVNSGNTWAALAGGIILAISNGGPMGVVFEFIAASVFYWLIAASLAEMASAVPSAGGVYHWASITAGRYGKPVGFFAGWWNVLAWTFALASVCQINGFIITSMYALYHPGFEVQRWQVFIAFELSLFLTFALVLWCNRILPYVEQVGGFVTIAGWLITVVVVAAMGGSGGKDRATDAFVWRDWQNTTGWKSDGLVFLLGMLNGSYAVGTPDLISHLAEEVPRPSKNLPKAILAQFTIGFITAFTFLIAIFYGISDFDAIIEDSAHYLFPITAIYHQCTGGKGAAFGLLFVLLLPNWCGAFGLMLTSSRQLWTLGRDNAAPVATWLGRVHQRNRNPSNAITVVWLMASLLGFIYLGSPTAFTAFVGSFVVMTSLSYGCVIIPHLLSRRQSVKPGWFWMKGGVGFLVNIVASAYIIVFCVIYLFPQVQPVAPASMNWAVVLIGGTSTAVAVFWVIKRKQYEGPPGIMGQAVEVSARDAL